ncbi:MAG: hypothetical protein ACM3XZ_05155 [Betaproteobacteria bacterium]
MARTTLAKTQAPGGYASTGAVLTLAAADVVNKNQFVATGNDLVVAQNTGASPATVTINSVADPYGRTKDVAGYVIPAGGIAVFGPFPVLGWQQPDGKVYLEASNADVKFAVVAL